MAKAKEPARAGGEKLVTVNRKAYHDYEIEEELEAGIALTRAAVEVENGVATIHLQNDGLDRRLAESAALAVPGILEVRFES